LGDVDHEVQTVGTCGYHRRKEGLSMRDLVEHSRTRLTLDFSKADFGGLEQTAVVDDWRARRAAGRNRRLSSPGRYICHFHRNHDNPSTYLHMDEDTGMIAASQERERTKQAALAFQRDALVWRELEHPASRSEPAS
jgi:hypothetical protein